MMGIASSLLSQDTVYDFRLASGNIAMTSNGSGVVQSFLSADPSGGSGSTWTATEWTALTSLFTEVRLRAVRMHICWSAPFDTNAWQSLTTLLAITPSLVSISSNPASIAAVWDNPESKLFNVNLLRSGSGISIIELRPRTLLNFATTAVPNPGSYAGCPGSIAWYGLGFPISANIGSYVIEGFYEFRNRS